jgi:hypothetical protein
MNDTPPTTTTATATIHSSYSYSCIPSTTTKNETYYNTITNETLVVSTNIDIYEIGILFNYEIHHTKNVSIYDTTNSGGVKEEESGSGWYDNTKNFFGNLFGNGDDDNDESENIKFNDTDEEYDNNATDGRLQLKDLEIYMISQFWKDALIDDDMRYDSSENNQNCTGLIIGRSNNTSTMTEIDEIDVAIDENNIYDDDETRLLGISYMPFDYINLDGCAEQQHPTTYNTCTSIHGQVNVAYSGMNEYGVIQTVILRLWDGMENGSYIPPLWKKGHDDIIQLVFLGAGDAVPVSNIGQSISIDSTASSVVQAANKDDDEGQSSNNLSKYGLLFVCFVAILGTGTFAAMYVRYKRRLRRKKGMIPTVDANDYNSSSIEGEVVERQEHEEDVTRTAPSSRSPTPSIIIDDTPFNVLTAVDVSVASGEIEVNLPPSPIVVADDDVTTTSTRKKWWVSIPMTRN